MRTFYLHVCHRARLLREVEVHLRLRDVVVHARMVASCNRTCHRMPLLLPLPSNPFGSDTFLSLMQEAYARTFYLHVCHGARLLREVACVRVCWVPTTAAEHKPLHASPPPPCTIKLNMSLVRFLSGAKLRMNTSMVYCFPGQTELCGTYVYTQIAFEVFNVARITMSRSAL